VCRIDYPERIAVNNAKIPPSSRGKKARKKDCVARSRTGGLRLSSPPWSSHQRTSGEVGSTAAIHVKLKKKRGRVKIRSTSTKVLQRLSADNTYEKEFEE